VTEDKTMNEEKLDPRLTAYVLDELEPEARATFEASLESDPALRAAMDELTATAQMVKAVLLTTDAPQLLNEQRTNIERSAEVKPKRAVFTLRRVAYSSLLACAAAALVVALLQIDGNRSTGSNERITLRFDETTNDRPTPAPAPASEIISDRSKSSTQLETVLPELKDKTDAYATSQPATTPTSGDSISQPSSSNLQNVQVGGAIRIRGSFFSNAVPTEENIALQDQQAPTPSNSVNSLGIQSSFGVDTDGDGVVDSDYFFEMPQPADRASLVPRLQDESGNHLYDQALPHLHLWGYMENEAKRNAFGRNNYEPIIENAFLQVAREPLSTFGLDVDTASYANVRRFLTSAQIPPPDAVRIEEFVNAFAYEYAAPSDGHSVAVSAEIAGCPWKAQHRLARIAVKAKDIPFEAQPPLRLTFLIDVSGSMENAKKLPLLKESMLALAKKLRATDQLAIVTYSDSARTVLRPTPANHIEIIHDVIDGLSANGSTNGAGGIELAYNAAKEQFLENGLNRVILASDGDFNVGETDNAALEQRIQDYAKSGVFLTVLGFGVDNLQDDRLEMLANKGNGNYFYIDSFAEANRVLVERMAGTIAVAAKDAKIQVEFNPAKVGAYRLLGYENRALTAPDFNNDAKDAGDIGAGQTVTALYEIVPVGVSLAGPGIDALKYQTPPPAPVNDNPEMMTVKLRYKEPTATESKRIELPVVDGGATVDSMSGDFRMAASAAAFAMLLRNSQYKGTADFDLVQKLAESAKGNAADRAEFVSLVVAAKTLAK